ncbi:MAG TPA: metallophosphoesterase [Ignavibacteria bacterium]|nr:metallophosphoesterase [Ignavibacteria bacterium]
MNYKNENTDSSGFSNDGPVVIYKNGKIISYSVTPEGEDHYISIVEINAKDKLTCYIDETEEHFRFNLKDAINTESDVYELPDKMLIVSDIEGNFRGLTMILKGAGIVNDKFEWIFGNGNLIFAGDLFDRGVNVTECLWLIYKLESEAELQGGKVHLILGNHEMMNLKKDFRYVRRKYLINADSLKLEYENWYAANTELGKWLRSKNSIEKIGDFLIMHAGISKDFPSDSLSLTDINNNIRSSIDKHFNKGEASKDIFIGSSGPLWYRGIVNEAETQNDIDNTLSAFNSSKMILGHTIVDTIKYLYDKKVIAIDLEHQENSDNGIMYALWFENGLFYIIDSNGRKKELG